MFAFVSNEKVNESIRNFDTTVNTAVNNSLNFVDDTQRVSLSGFLNLFSHFAGIRKLT